jgi:hypothetical protein
VRLPVIVQILYSFAGAVIQVGYDRPAFPGSGTRASMAAAPQSFIRRLLWRLRAAAGPAPASAAEIAQIGKRLERIERQLDSVHKIWLRTRHVEPAVQAVLRELYLDRDRLPYPQRLTAQRFRLFSQNQEDGLTFALLNEAGIATRKFVEIGSGLSGGNSAFLSIELGWAGLMVDGKARMDQVRRRFPRVTAVPAWVTTANINALIADNGFGGEVDLFSLDIDSTDYWIWDAMTACSPRVVILEYNSMFGGERAVTVPNDATFMRKDHHSAYYGASLAALTKASARKGYRLVAVEPAGVNAFYLRNDLAPHIPACDPQKEFRLLERHDVLMNSGEDIYAYIRDAGMPLVDVA